MSAEKDLIVTLDNGKEYAIVYNIMFNEKNYVYLAELEDFKNYIIGELANDEIIHVTDTNLLGQLIMEFAKLEE